MVCAEAFSTGRSVRFADEVLTPTMFRVPDALTASVLQVLTAKTEKRYAKANIRLVGVLPWLQAHLTPMHT